MEWSIILLIVAGAVILGLAGAVAFLMIQKRQIERVAEERADALIAEVTGEGALPQSVSEIRNDSPSHDMRDAA